MSTHAHPWTVALAARDLTAAIFDTAERHTAPRSPQHTSTSDPTGAFTAKAIRPGHTAGRASDARPRSEAPDLLDELEHDLAASAAEAGAGALLWWSAQPAPNQTPRAAAPDAAPVTRDGTPAAPAAAAGQGENHPHSPWPALERAIFAPRPITVHHGHTPVMSWGR